MKVSSFLVNYYKKNEKKFKFVKKWFVINFKLVSEFSDNFFTITFKVLKTSKRHAFKYFTDKKHYKKMFLIVKFRSFLTKLSRFYKDKNITHILRYTQNLKYKKIYWENKFFMIYVNIIIIIWLVDFLWIIGVSTTYFFSEDEFESLKKGFYALIN